MRKLLVIASREYFASVKTKAFLIGMAIMPLMMGGSFIVQRLLKDVHDTTTKTIAVIDRTPGQSMELALQQAEKRYNEKAIFDPETGKQVKPKVEFVFEDVGDNTQKTIDDLRVSLSERVSEGDFLGFLEIGKHVLEVPQPPKPEQRENPDASRAIRYQTNRPTERSLAAMAVAAINGAVRADRKSKTSIKLDEAELILQPVSLISKGLSKRNEEGEVVDESKQGEWAPVVVPFALMMLMFMITMMGATPLMQSVLEEKMQRIAEVLLGSVRPFTLMLGKLLGMTAVSMTISFVYLSGVYATAYYLDFADYVTPAILIWFLVFQTLTTLMFGSLFIAIGAACTDFKETQNLMLPVMLLACIPLFLLGKVIQDPNGPVVAAVSYFPFATPMLMLARLAVPPGLPWWQPAIGMAGVLLTTAVCVYAAGRIFRVGILMQGKGAKVGDLWRWVIKG